MQAEQRRDLSIVKTTVDFRILQLDVVEFDLRQFILPYAALYYGSTVPHRA
jgi:hypothetical protein